MPIHCNADVFFSVTEKAISKLKTTEYFKNFIKTYNKYSYHTGKGISENTLASLLSEIKDTPQGFFNIFDYGIHWKISKNKTKRKLTIKLFVETQEDK